MAEEKLSEIMQAQLYAHKHGLLDDALGRAVRKCLRLNVIDDFVTNELLTRVKRHKVSQAFAGPFLRPMLHKGEELRGYDQKGNPIYTPVKFRSGNSLTLAGSGGGKSIKAKHTVIQIAPHVQGMWLFDFRKREWAELFQPLRALGIEVVSVTIHQVRLNILQVPSDVDPLDYASRLAECLVQDLTLPPRASKLLHAALLKLFRDNGVLDGSQNFPHLGDLYTSIHNDKGSNPQARQAITDALEPVLLSLGHEVLGVRRGWTTSDLANRFVHFDFSGAAETDKLLVMNNLMLREFMARIARRVSNPEQVQLYITLDEAGSLISSSNSNSGLLDLFSLIRGTGISVELGTQYADIHPAILSNTSNKAIGRCGSARDFEVMGSAIGLTAEQQAYIRHHLRPGLFIEQVGEGAWRYPYLVSIPYTKPSSSAPQSAPDTSAPDSITIDYAPVSWPFNNINEPVAVSTEPPARESQLSSAELRFLATIVANPGLPSSAYAQLARVGGNQAKKLRTRLVQEGYLKEHAVNTGGRGRSAIVLELLEPALNALDAQEKASEGARN